HGSLPARGARTILLRSDDRKLPRGLSTTRRIAGAQHQFRCLQERRMTALATAVVRDAAAIEQLAPEWWVLWRRIPSGSPCQSPAWLIPWWRAFAPGILFVITVREGGRLVGLAPCYIEHGAPGR